MKLRFNFQLSAFSFFILACWSGSLAAPLPQQLPPVGAYSASIGLTSVAVFDDPSVIYWNPAGLAMMNQMVAQLTLVSFSKARPTSWSALMASNSSGEGSAFGLALLRRRSTNWAGEYTSFEVITPLSFKQRSKNLPFGISLKLQSENYGEKWVYGFRMDAGAAIVSRDGGMKIAVSTQNVIGGRLRAFPHESWIGLAAGSDTSSFRLSMQARFDRPFDGDYISQNYSLGGRWKLGYQNPFQLCAGLIRQNTQIRYTTGFGYDTRLSTSHFEAAVIYDPRIGADRTYYVTYGYAVHAGAPSRSGSPVW
jgi:hypothetical protein